MREFLDALRFEWARMSELPWRYSGSKGDSALEHWVSWLIGWTWALAGLALGALYAPSLLQFAGFSDSPYRDWLVIAVAVLAGFVVQLFGWALLESIALFAEHIGRSLEARFGTLLPYLGFLVLVAVVVALPLAGVGFGIYLYFTQVGAVQRAVTIAFLGGLLVKTFLIPFIKSLITGALFKWFIDWLRGGKKKGT